jgi:hypothetical protein
MPRLLTFIQSERWQAVTRVLFGSVIMAGAWLAWRWVLVGTEAGLLLPWQIDSSYLIRYRSGTRWTWLLDPFGVVLGLWLVLGATLIAWLWRRPEPWDQREPVLLLGWQLIAIAIALWYGGCTWGLLALPMG